MTTDILVILRASPQDFFQIVGIEKFNDGSGYASRLTVGSGRFSCSEHPFYFHDLNGFTKRIAQAYEQVLGKARLGDPYEQDFIEIEVFRGGHVSVTGFIRSYAPGLQELRFCFMCDQTFLPDLLRSLKHAAKNLEVSA